MVKTMMKLLSKFKNQFLSKFKQLSRLKKIVLIMFLLFPLFWYWATNSFYYYILNIIGVPQLSSLTGLSIDTINWILFTLPFYFKIIFIIAFSLLIILIIWKKKKRTKWRTPYDSQANYIITYCWVWRKELWIIKN